MRFTPRFLDELRDRLRVTDIVGRKVRLIRRGHNHVGLCPFHNEKTPSFSVNEQKGFYHCFGCGAHGDIITFVMETEGLSFPEAVEQLATQAGMPLPARDEREEEREKTRKSLYDICELACAFFEGELKGAKGKKAREYLDGRGLVGPSVAPFRLGFAPDSRIALRDHLKARDVSIDDMVEAGLLIAPDDGSQPYDRFRGRVIFPIADGRGRIIAFGGRTLDPEGQPKYLNSPETPLFRKSAVLFNLASARKAVAQGAQLVAVEGYVDVIALVAAGFGGAVAPLGTALTEEHLGMMWRMAPEPILCFDGDAAGQKAAYRSLELALALLEPGQSLRFAMLPEGQDPDDLIRAKGAAAMHDVLSAAQPLSDMLWRRETEGHDLSTPERRAGFESRMMSLVNQISEQKVREHYRRLYQERIREMFGGPAPAGERGGRKWQPSGPRRRWGEPPSPARDHREARAFTGAVSDALKRSVAARASANAALSTLRTAEALLLAVLNHPFLLDEELETLDRLTIEDASLDKVRRELLHAASSGQSLDSQGLRDHLTDRGLGGVYQAMEQRPLLRSMPFTQPGTAAQVVREGFTHAIHRYRKRTDLENERILAAAALKSDESEESRLRLAEVDRALKALEGSEAGPPDSSGI
ncbi:MAG: DNA primase [Alphaproteobacteria bacterium]|nr:DNA primase [Alphaproteobacteria bacterium]